MDGTSTAPMLARLPRGYRNDRHIGLVYEIEPAGADDLTVIAGIATREAVILNRLGIYFIAQIGLWRHHELVAISHELQVSPGRIVDEQWVEQARSLCSPIQPSTRPAARPTDLPASFFRTFVLLACALLVGLLLVNLLRYRESQYLHGVLSADITALKVPAASRLITAHVKPGDKVLSGAPLLTLEKVEHLSMIEEQQRRVQQLERELRQAEAQASLDLAWRTRELERELFDVQSQAAFVDQAVQFGLTGEQRSAALLRPQTGRLLSSVSSSRIHERAEITRRPGTLLFFGATATASPVVAAEPGLPPRPTPTTPKLPPTRIAQARPASTMSEPSIASTQAQNLESRLARLESLRSSLPDQVRQAAGLESLRIRFTEASVRLDEMKTVSREVAVSCPAYGTIGQVKFREGDRMSEGDVMLKILHTDRRYVMVYVPADRVNELQPGEQVRLTFPGRVHYLGQVMNLPLLADTVSPGGETVAAVRIEPVGRLWPNVPIGSQVDVVAVK